jgi:hypothetical protein
MELTEGCALEPGIAYQCGGCGAPQLWADVEPCPICGDIVDEPVMVYEGSWPPSVAEDRTN